MLSKEEVEAFKFVPDINYITSLQETDRGARRVMKLISEGKFEELKKEYNVDFEVKDDAIHFGEPESNSPFQIELASNSMYIANFLKGKNDVQIGYFIYNPNYDRSDLIYMSFDNEMNFLSIFVGDA